MHGYPSTSHSQFASNPQSQRTTRSPSPGQFWHGNNGAIHAFDNSMADQVNLGATQHARPVAGSNGMNYWPDSMNTGQRSSTSNSNTSAYQGLANQHRGANDRLNEAVTGQQNLGEQDGRVVAATGNDGSGPNVGLFNPSLGNQASRSQDTSSMPIWALLPKHTYNSHPANAVLSDFLYQNKHLFGEGLLPATFFAEAPMLDALLNPQADVEIDEISRWAAQWALNSCKQDAQSTMNQVVSLYMAWTLMTWMINPTPETYKAVPVWLRPTRDQLTYPHNISGDFLFLPQLRDTVVSCAALQQSSTWVEKVSRSIDCNWPQTLSAGLERDGSTGALSLNPMTWDHINCLENWSIGYMPVSYTHLTLPTIYSV